MDDVPAHDHVAGAVGIDGIAVLARAAGPVVGVLDPVVEHQRAVMSRGRADDLDAVVSRIGEGVAVDGQARGVVGKQRHVGGVRDGGAGDLALARCEQDAVAAGAQDRAIDDPHAAARFDVQEPLVRRSHSVFCATVQQIRSRDHNGARNRHD